MHIDPRDVELCLDDEFESTALSGPRPTSRPTSAPIVQTSLFSFPTLEELIEALGSESGRHVYTRGQNPTVEALEKKLAALERGESCKAFASGMAAISAVFLGLLKSGDHIVFLNRIYGPTLQLARQLQRFGVEHDVVPGETSEGPRIGSLEAAIRPETRLIWVESPGTMLFQVVDLAAVVEVARRHNVLTALDNTWATPLLQKPLTLGFDLSMHTATKYLGGHSDVVAGAVVGGKELMEQIFRRAFLLLGGILAPWDAWLILRGMRTLPARLREHETSALALASMLAEHPAVAAVHHPDLERNPAVRQMTARQMTGYSGVFSFELKDGSWESTCRVVNALRRFRIGVSWGGVESLVISHKPKKSPQTRPGSLPPGLIRLSVGLEGTEVLAADLRAALAVLE